MERIEAKGKKEIAKERRDKNRTGGGPVTHNERDYTPIFAYIEEVPDSDMRQEEITIACSSPESVSGKVFFLLKYLTKITIVIFINTF